MEQKGYSKSEVELAFQWVQHFCDLERLLLRLLHPSPPTESQEQKYQRLRRWLLTNEQRIAPIWRDFWQHRDLVLNGEYDTLIDLNNFIEMAGDTLYNPESCRDVVDSLRGTEDTVPDEFCSLANIVVEFYLWVAQQECRSVSI